jgi:glycosyltransferase involved in cell wall biosynthesis
VGEGPDRKRLERLAVKEGVSGQVRFAGRVPDEELPAYYETCDLFALPSTEEGFGIVYLEAMSHGKPCIGARAAAAPEVIVDGQTGLLALPDDRVSLESALLRLLEFPDEAKRMGQAGRQRLQEQFSFDAFQRRLSDIFGVEMPTSVLRKAA